MRSFHEFINYLQNTSFADSASLKTIVLSAFANPTSFFGEEAPTYNEDSEEIAKKLQVKMTDRDPSINITRSFTDTDIPVNSIAYHRIFGPILADDEWRWYFSSKQFMRDIKAAENNPNIHAHFLHVSTGGGEAWLLEKVHEAVKNTTKPTFAFIEKVCCSAGLYIICPANVVKAYTVNDTIGSLGTMVSFLDITGYFEAMGAKWIEEYAERSDLKNKKFNDLIDGKPDRYIKEELNPLQEQFEAAVRAARPGLASLKDDHPVFRGDTFSAEKLLAEKIDLIDGLAEIEEAVLECHQMGLEYGDQKKAQQKALSYLP